MKQLIIIFLLAIAIQGCTICKPYSRPNITTDSLFGNVQNQENKTLATLPWQEFFTDTYLRGLIEKGLEKNTDFNIARLKVEAAEAVLMNARLSYLPSATLTAEGTVTDFGHSSTKSYNIATAASWEIDAFGKRLNTKRGAKAALEGSRAYERAVKVRLIAAIANSYYTLLMLDRQLTISKQTVESWEDMEKTFTILKKAGKSNGIAVLQAKSSRMALQANMLSLQKNRKETENSLSSLLATTPQSIERGNLEKQTFPEKLSIGFPIQLLSYRPDVQQAEYELAQAFYATNVTRLAFYPDITLSGITGWTNNGGGNIVNPGSWLLNSMGALTQPLFNRGTNRANLKVAQTRQKEAALLFQQSLLNAGKEVNDALTQVQTAKKRRLLNKEQINSLQEAVSKTKYLMRYSSINYLDVLTARQNLLNAEQTEIQDCFDEIQGMINLYHALGGGS